MSIPRTGPKLSAGVLTADLTRLGDELAILRGTGCWAHVDIMDGSFCPQLTVGPAFVAAVASAGIPVDAHLLVDEPRRLLPDIVAAGPAVVTVHAEATRHPHRTLTELTALAAEQPDPVVRGVAISPGTPVTAVEPLLELTDLVLVLAVDPGWPGQQPAASTRRRVAAVRDLAAGLGRPVMVGVDGGVTMANAAEIAGWGADVVVSGSAIYDGRDPAGNLDRMLARLSMAPERSTDDQQRPEREDRGPAHPDEDHPDRGGGP
ncbi:MAG TPA: ribulose-phosphate 3-epimerase [Streptosporangiaceae bacterium]|jgi:ribulose-phosphate 3-epimerase|nr:ribulose-phosphate 3-epimerase [Streptosporangiaceae bacterium]